MQHRQAQRGTPERKPGRYPSARSGGPDLSTAKIQILDSDGLAILSKETAAGPTDVELHAPPPPLAGLTEGKPVSSNVLIAIAVITVGVYGLSLLLRKVEADEAKWFAAILQSTDEELSARTLPALTRDCSRMKEIRLVAGNRSGVSRTSITYNLANEQLERLIAARDTVARRHHQGAAVPEATTP